MKHTFLLILFQILFVFKGFSQSGIDGSDFKDLMDALIDGINTGMESRGSAADMDNNVPTLSLDECVPDFTQDLSNGVVVSCNEEPQCIECFTKTYEKLNFYRRQLARMRCIYNNTKTYKEKLLLLATIRVVFMQWQVLHGNNSEPLS
jgi:hypothetical protein